MAAQWCAQAGVPASVAHAKGALPAGPACARPGAWRPLGRPARGLLAALLAGLLASCAKQPAQPILFPNSTQYQGFLVDQPLPPFQALGAAQISYHGQVESGELLLRAQPGPAYLVQLRARITGSLALEVRFDSRDVLVLDYGRRTYFLGDNDTATRLRLFQADLTAQEFQWLLTGRVTSAQFLAGAGRMEPAGVARFAHAGDEYVFSLDGSGLPTAWTKLHDGQPVFRVEYRGYLDVAAAPGAVLRLPGKIRVYLQDSQPGLILGLSQVEPVPGSTPPIDFQIPQDVLDNFQAE